MKRAVQYCKRQGACQKVNCKFVHSRDHQRPKYCWRNDDCKKDDCKFFHPRDSLAEKSDDGKCVESLQSEYDEPNIESVEMIRNEKISAPRETDGIFVGKNDEKELSTSVQLKVKVTKPLKRNSNESVLKSAKSRPVVKPHHIQSAESNYKFIRKDEGHSSQPRKLIVKKSTENSSNGRSCIEHDDDAYMKGAGQRKLVEAVSTDAIRSRKTPTQSESAKNLKASRRPENFKVNAKSATKSSGNELPGPVQSTETGIATVRVNKKGRQCTNTQASDIQSKETGESSRRRRRYGETVIWNSNITRVKTPEDLARRVDYIQKDVAIKRNQQIVPIQPEWNSDEFDAFVQHRNIIDGIKEQISRIVLSEDYSTDFEKHEVNIQVLREKIIELESHVSIFDSVKSRACRELAVKPTELCNQIHREIYRFKCRLGAFTKRLDMEKYFSSGHRFLIVQGQTGSGKSTQLPQYVADHPRFYGKKIICTQPRKLAAISLSRRVAFEYSGGIVRNDSLPYIGYQVGGDRRDMKGCRIEFVTEGIMLERIMKGDMESFKNVGCIIIDEAHERSITCDLLLGSFKKPDPRWKDLLIITTSATIDLTLFSEFFLNAPIVQIEGRTFPVDIIYQPVTDTSTELQSAVAHCALQIHFNCKSSPGDILCFLPGLEDIRNARSMFEKEFRRKTIGKSAVLDVKVFILYGKQEPDEQAEVFQSIDASTKRKIIFATDVAETSITINGIVYVVDSGVRKEIVFDPERNISSLKINSISKSSAIQRAGRCGRTQPGVCYRLYSQDEFESMNINAVPEVLCKPISLAVLTLLELSIDPENFDWISQPHKEAIRNAEKELKLLGAVDAHRKPTELGNFIAKSQQDPKIMKIVYIGCAKGFGEAACSIASILSVSNTFFWNGNDADTKSKAMQRRRQFAMPEGDVVTMYRIFEEFKETYNGRQRKKSSEQSDETIVRKSASVWCNENSLNAKSMFTALTTRTELINQLKRTNIWSKCRSQNKSPANLEVQELVCSGYFMQCARVFYSKNSNAPVEYFSTESAVAGRLDFRSSLKLLDMQPPPTWIVYDKIVRLPSTIFPIASVMDEMWLKNANSDFYEMCLKKVEDLPTKLIEISISQVSFRMIVGRNFCNVDALEKELGCLLTGDADTGKMHLYCAPIKANCIQERILSKIEDALTEIKMQVIEENYKGETRLLIGEGYEIKEIIFDKEFTTFYIKNVHETIDKAVLKDWLTMRNERLQTLDFTRHDKTYTAVAKFTSKTDAKSAYDRMSLIDKITVAPSYGGGNCIRHGLICRLKLTWPTAISKGIANIFFHTAEDGNNFLDNVQFIYPTAAVRVSGETQRKAQLKLNGLRPKFIEPPLTYLRFNNHHGCRFRFDVAAISQMSNKDQLNYRVTLSELSLKIDKYELQTTLNVYSPKNIILEYENIVTPDAGNGLTKTEKEVKLEPLSRFMDADTKTSDFFKRNTGIAGICLFFNSNTIAKEAYNYAKSKYHKVPSDLYGPHRLEIEFTHTVSIQIGLYRYLESQIDKLQKNARDKGMGSVVQPIQDNAKTVILRFTTGKQMLLTWIQEQLDELVRPTKFNCLNSDVLFTRTGELELMKLAKNIHINWSDETRKIWVYGSPDDKEKCCNDIEQIALRLSSLDVLDKEIWLNKTVRLNGKEGQTIRNKCKAAKVAYHHFHGRKMFASGSQKSVDAVVQFLAQNKFSWDRSNEKRFQYEETRECGLCFMPPDKTFIMLSVCGHLFCSDCIEAMVMVLPPPFPIRCPVCEEYVALHDIKKLAPAKSLVKVLELAVPEFQRNHSYDIRQCPNPGCQQLLCYGQRTTGTDGGDFLFCDQCIATYCIICSDAMGKPVKSHDDDSCENIQSGVANLVFKHVRIIQETVFNLSCPNCKTAFYEFDDCAAVTCRNVSCGAGFCGLCLQNCGKDAHPHVKTCSKNPGGRLYVDKSVLDAAHKDMRNGKLNVYLQHHQLNAKVQQQIVDKIRKDLLDLGMNVPVISPEAYDEATTETSTDVWHHVREIQDNILTLSCPNCRTAFFDFDGCAAVTCNHCLKEFCGLCLDFTSDSVRMHVIACERNARIGHVFVNSNELLEIHGAVRSDKIQSYFDEKIPEADAKEKVFAIIRRDLSDLRIKSPDMTKRRVPPPVPVRAAPVRVVPVHPQRVFIPQQQQRDLIREQRRLQQLEQEIIIRRDLQQREHIFRRPAAPPRPPPRRECCIL